MSFQLTVNTPWFVSEKLTFNSWESVQNFFLSLLKLLDRVKFHWKTILGNSGLTPVRTFLIPMIGKTLHISYYAYLFHIFGTLFRVSPYSTYACFFSFVGIIFSLIKRKSASNEKKTNKSIASKEWQPWVCAMKDLVIKGQWHTPQNLTAPTRVPRLSHTGICTSPCTIFNIGAGPDK